MNFLLIERSGDSDEIRALLIDQDEETGRRLIQSVVHVDRSPKSARAIVGLLGGDFEIDPSHLVTIDFGRAKSLVARVQKVIEQI